jgi:hypothetical protein
MRRGLTALALSVALSAPRSAAAQIGFDDGLGNSSIVGQFTVAPNYKGLIWSSRFFIAKPGDFPSPVPGLTSLVNTAPATTGGTNQAVAFANAFGPVNNSPAVYFQTTSGTFDFFSAYVAALWRADMKLTIVGYDATGIEIKRTAPLTISTTATLIRPNITGATTIGFFTDAGQIIPGQTSDGTAFAIDAINVSAVPEPSSVLLVGAGLAGLAAVTRRRRR